MLKKVAILSSGGDAPGLNAVIRAIVKTGEENGVECFGFINGYKGLLENDYVKLDSNGNASGLLHRGGTMLKSTHSLNVFNMPEEKDGETIYVDKSDECIENLRNEGFECLFTIGGDGTQKSARDFSVKGFPVIGIPKTIDNDVPATDITFGYNTAVNTVAEAIDKLHTTADSHNRIMVVEAMGRNAGWIALEAGIAGGADAILIPEIPYDIEVVAKYILNRKDNGKEFSIVVVAEGAMPKGGEISVKENFKGKGIHNVRLGGIGEKITEELKPLTKMDIRHVTLGHLQRGGIPTPFDRVLSTKYGAAAMRLALKGTFNVLVSIKNANLSYATLEEVVGENTEIGAASGGTKETSIRNIQLDDDLILTAKSIGICLGSK